MVGIYCCCQEKEWKKSICVDFIVLSKVCPKDSFPLPIIDQLIDATTGLEVMSFLDAFPGYS